MTCMLRGAQHTLREGLERGGNQGSGCNRLQTYLMSVSFRELARKSPK